MAEKTPHELLRESLERNAREVATWPSWMRTAISTKGFFSVAPDGESSGPLERDDTTQMARPKSAG